jgi:hypothetical protein
VRSHLGDRILEVALARHRDLGAVFVQPEPSAAQIDRALIVAGVGEHATDLLLFLARNQPHFELGVIEIITIEVDLG